MYETQNMWVIDASRETGTERCDGGEGGTACTETQEPSSMLRYYMSLPIQSVNAV